MEVVGLQGFASRDQDTKVPGFTPVRTMRAASTEPPVKDSTPNTSQAGATSPPEITSDSTLK